MTDLENNWELIQDSFIPEETLSWEGLFTQGSGYIHTRGSFEEALGDSPQNIEYNRNADNVSAEKFVKQSTKWGTYIPGIYSPVPVYVSEITNMPFCLGIDIYAAGERLDTVRSRIEDFKRILDLKTALLKREMTWSTKTGAIITLKYRRFIDAVNKKLIIQQVSVISDEDIILKVRAGIDADIRTNGNDHYTDVECRGESKGCFCRVGTEGGNTVDIATAMSGDGWKTDSDERACYQVKEFGLKAAEELILEKRSAYSTDRDLDCTNAKEVLESVSGLSFENIFSDHTARWEKWWETCDIEIKGDPRSQLETRVSIYHLLRSHVDDSRVAIDAKGYAGEAYWGKFYWDTEMFMMPFFLYTDPKKAKTLTDFRIGCLQASRENAKDYGYSGARFAWNCDDTGRECAAMHVWQHRDHEIHVTGDVAYGFYHYAKAIGDDDYLRKDAAETIIEMCRYWMDRIDIRDGVPCILAVTGPDEYTPLIHNNSFTNRLVILTLKLGCKIGILYGVDSREIESWKDTAGKIPIPRRHDGLILQSEDFELLAEPDFEKYWPDRSKPWAATVHQDRNYRTKAIKQPDVLMMMWLFAGEFTREEIQAAWDYYEPLCTHDSSLSQGIHGLIALRLGMDEKAWQYWKYTAGLDLDIKKGKAAQGMHIACCAATWQMLVFGFAGIRPAIETETLTLVPRLPEKWEKLSFPFVWKGQGLFIEIGHREAIIKNKTSMPLAIYFSHKKYEIGPGEEKHISYKK